MCNFDIFRSFLCLELLFCHFRLFSTKRFNITEVLLKENYSQTHFTPNLWGWEDNAAFNRTLFPRTCSCGNSAFVEISVVYTTNKPEKFEGVVNVLNQLFANQWSCLAEIKSLIIKSSPDSVNHLIICSRCYGHSDCSTRDFGQRNRVKADV